MSPYRWTSSKYRTQSISKVRTQIRRGGGGEQAGISNGLYSSQGQMLKRCCIPNPRHKLTSTGKWPQLHSGGSHGHVGWYRLCNIRSTILPHPHRNSTFPFQGPERSCSNSSSLSLFYFKFLFILHPNHSSPSLPSSHPPPPSQPIP